MRSKSDGGGDALSGASSGTYSGGLDYSKALGKTIMLEKYRERYPEEDLWYKRMFGGCIFQVLLVSVFLIVVNEIDPLIFGLSYLEKEPNHFECESEDVETHEQVWRECKKHEICERGLGQEQHRADTKDDEYIDGWVQKFDLLCEPKWKVGLIGSMYFIGVIATLTFVPIIADSCGRKWVFCVTLVIGACAQLGLMITRNLYELYVYEFLIGATFAGRVIVGLNYVLEFTQRKYAEDLVFYLLISECIGTIILSFWYQMIDNGWCSLQLTCFITAVVTLLYFIIVVPESPKWQHAWERYSEARTGLRYVASFNGAPKRQQEKLGRLRFAGEKLKEARDQIDDKSNPGEDLAEVEAAIARQRSIISDNQYIWNVISQTIMWTVASFTFYMLQFMNKYFEGFIYTNYYLDSVAGICGSLLALATYKYIRMKWSFMISLVLTLVSGTFLLLF
jgi:MFS family permease